MAEKYLEVKIVSDDSGHEYVIPIEWEDEFYEYVEMSEDDSFDIDDEVSLKKYHALEEKFYPLMGADVTLYQKVVR